MMKRFFQLKFILRLVAIVIIVVLFLGSAGRVYALDMPTITEFPSRDGPWNITSGPDGNLWFALHDNSSMIGRISPDGITSDFPLLTNSRHPLTLTSGPDGNVWFTEPNENKIGKITPEGTITEYSISTANSYPQGITSGPDGNLWFTETSANNIGRITPEGVITEFPVPTSDSLPVGITAGSDGNIWFTEYSGNKIGKITPEGTITEYSISTNASGVSVLTSGPDGNVWFTEPNENKIGKITPEGTITKFSIPTNGSFPYGIISGSDGNLWFTEMSANNIGRITPEGVITEFPVPTSDSFPVGITAGSDGNIWFTEYSGNKIGRVDLGSLAPAPTPTPTPVPAKTPLILIPGVGGSEFKSNQVFLSGIQDCGNILSAPFIYSPIGIVWIDPIMAGISSCDDYFDVLKLKADGLTPEYPQIILNNTFVGVAYGDFIKFFTDNGYELGETLFLFPYDWRKDISLTLTPLNDLINTIKTQTGSAKVDIVAHSMGGLVSRNYISDSSRAQNVRKLFTLGTPHLGAVDSLKNIRFGGCLTKGWFLTELAKINLCFGVAPREVKDIVQNMISGFELVPSQEYFNFYNGQDNKHLSPYKNNNQTFSYNQIKSFLTGLNYNTGLFSPSELFHVLDNSLSNTNGVEITNIAGSGLETLGQIIEKNVKDFLGNTVQKKDGISVNGDKTVPLFSSSLNDPSRNLSLFDSANVFYTNQEHGELVAFGSALNLVKNILNNDVQLPVGVLNYPYPFSGTQMSIYSPVNIHVYDSEGRHTGPTSNGDFEANIPGSSYDTLDDAKFIFLPDDGIYDLKFEATDQGSFDFKIRKYENDAITNEILYKDIPLEETTSGETEFDTTANIPPVLRIDENNDGITDEEINPSSNLTGDAIYDEISPTTNFQIYGELGNNGWFKSDAVVTLIPQDDASDSGILKTEYSLDDGQTVNIYTEPFVISTEGINKLKFRSVDNAGNEEDPKETEIKIDKTAPEAKIFIDQNLHDLVVSGIDKNQTSAAKTNNTLTKKKNDAFYIISDEAGNTLKIDIRDRDWLILDRFRIYSFQYNNDPAITLASNHFNVAYKGIKKKANVIYQSFEVKGDLKIKILYNFKNNSSSIVVRENKKDVVREVRNGFIYLNLLTDKGQLKTSY